MLARSKAIALSVSFSRFVFELSRSDYYPYTPPKCLLVTEVRFRSQASA